MPSGGGVDIVCSYGKQRAEFEKSTYIIIETTTTQQYQKKKCTTHIIP